MISQHDLELLNAYIDNALDADARATLEARLNAEPALRRELEALRAVSNMVRALPTLSAPRSFALTPEAVRHARTAPLQRALPLLGTAAAIALVLFGAILFSRFDSPPSQISSANTAIALVSTTTPLPTQLPPMGGIAVTVTPLPMPTQLAVLSARILPTPTVGTGIDPMTAAQSTGMIDLMAAPPASMAAQDAPEMAGDDLRDIALPEQEMQAEAFAAPALPGAADNGFIRQRGLGAALTEVVMALLRLLVALLSGN